MKEGSGGGGWSVALVRSETGERAWRETIASKAVVAEEISLEDAARMHGHAFDLKKRGSFLRLDLWRRFGCAVPRYDRRPPREPFGRRAGEILVSAQFALASSKAGRLIFAALPLGATGRLFASLRAVWMRRSSRGPGGA
jgi:hypothetical protein